MKIDKPGQSGIVAALYQLTEERVKADTVNGKYIGDDGQLILLQRFKSYMERPELLYFDYDQSLSTK